jgi:hypothetical protein
MANISIAIGNTASVEMYERRWFVRLKIEALAFLLTSANLHHH